MQHGKKAQAYGETAFDICYLVCVLCLGGWYITSALAGNKAVVFLYGSMALVLGIGDAFHLIPRIFANLSQDNQKWSPYLGVGKMITSITMTIFYILLFYVWRMVYEELTLPSLLYLIIYLLGALRILLCLMPQNHWIQNKDYGKWPIYRNFPFILLGICIVLLYSYSAYRYQDGFMFMPVAITLSFLFYIPVTLYSAKTPKVGMLMLPKTVMYIWIVCMGMQLL